MTTLDLESITVAIVALTLLLLVAGAEAMWRRRSRRAMADQPRPTSGTDPVTAVLHQARHHPIGRRWSGAQGLEPAPRLPGRREAAVAWGIIKIVAVYRTYPVMVVGETAEGTLLERSLHELAKAPEFLPPGLWQELAEQYHVFQIR
jgi:hypothetical protein